MLGFDTETALIREALLAPPLACLSYSDGQNADLIHWRDAYRPARWLLEQETTTANGPYDLTILYQQFPDLGDLIWEGLDAGRYHDVITRQKLMDIGEGCYRSYYRRLPGKEKITLLNYGLSDLHARYYGSYMEKDEWRLQYGHLRDIYPLQQWPLGARQYAMFDAGVTVRIHGEQDKQADPRSVSYTHKNNLWDEAFQIRADFVLYLMSCRGISCDHKQVQKLIAEIDAETPDLVKTLTKIVYDQRGNPRGTLLRVEGVKDVTRLDEWRIRKALQNGEKLTRSEKLAKELMFEAVGEAGELTNTGYKKVKAQEMSKLDALRSGYIKIDEEWCLASKNPALQAYYKYRQNQNLRTKLTHMHEAAVYGLPIQTSFEVLMETGRTSSKTHGLIRNSQGLQNPPREGGFRECFVARPCDRHAWLKLPTQHDCPDCHTIIACDFNQAELVALSQVTYAAFGFSKMRDTLNAGMDMHVDFGKEIFAINTGQRVDYDAAFKLYKIGDKIWDDLRQMAKGFNFGKPGGLGSASFMSYLRKAWHKEITEEQSKRLGAQWLRYYPEMKLYFKWMSDLMEAGGGKADIQSYMSGRWRGKCRYTQGCNNMFQSLTADGAKAALYAVSRACYYTKSSPLYGASHPILFVHDEILTEVRRSQAHEAAKEMERLMVTAYSRYTPDVLVKADAHLMDRWSKKAKAVHDDYGRLVPWMPPQDEDEKIDRQEMMLAAA